MKVVEEEREEEDLVAGLESMSQKDKCYVLLSNIIKDLASNTTKQFLEITKQIKVVDDKLESLAKTVHDIEALVVHVKSDACWTKAYLKKEAEMDQSKKEKDGSDYEES